MGDRQYATCRITYAVPDHDAGDDWVRLEQPDWQEPPDGGLFAWLKEKKLSLTLANVLDYQEQYRSQCNQDGTLEIEIFAYKSRPDLAYAMSASYGELTEQPTKDQADKVEYVSIGMDDGYTLDTVPTGAVSAEWEGQVRGTDGSVITPAPAITVNGQKLSWGVKCKGKLKIKYTADRDVWILTLTPRTGDDVDREDKSTLYASTVTAFWGNGEYYDHDVDLPDLSGYCGRDGDTTVGDDDDDDDEDCVRHVIVRDPCTEEIIDEFDEPMQCPDAGDGTDEEGA